MNRFFSFLTVALIIMVAEHLNALNTIISLDDPNDPDDAILDESSKHNRIPSMPAHRIMTKVMGLTTSDLYREGYRQNCSVFLKHRANHSDVFTNQSLGTDEQRLTCFLLHNYSNAVRPVKDPKKTMVVYFSLSINQIFDLDDRNQALTTNVWFEETWTDEFLSWDPAEFGGISTLNIPAFYLFIPDIELYNTAADYTKKRMQFRAMVNYNGTVFYGNPVKLTSTCHVNPTFFPFDTQICRLKFGSWTHSGFEIDLQPSAMGEADVSRLVTNGKWDVIDVVQKRSSIVYSCCEEPYVDISYYVVLKRKPLHYLLNVYFFTIMLAVMTTAVYQLPIDSGEKCALGTSVLFSVSVFMLSLTERLPESSDYVPIIFVYIFVVMGMTAVSLMLTIGIHAIHFQHAKYKHKSKIPELKRVPKCMMQIVEFHRRRRGKWVSEVVKDCQERYNQKKKFIKKLRSYQRSIDFEMRIYSRAKSNEDLAVRDNDSLDASTSTSGSSSPRHGIWTEHCFEYDITDRIGDFFKGRVAGLLNEINYAIERLADSYEAQVTRTFSLIEWHELAEALDAILFWIFLSFNIAVLLVVFCLADLVTPNGRDLLASFDHRHEPPIMNV